MFKKLWVRILLGLFALAVIGLVVAYLYLDVIVKRGVEKVGPAITKTEVKLDGVHISPFSGNGEVKGLIVGNPEGFKTPSAIQVKSVAVALEPGSVLGDKVIIRSVKVIGPEVTFEGGLAGNNLSKLLENVQGTSEKKGQPTTKQEEKATTRKLQVDEFVITGGRIHVSATFLGGQAATATLPEIHLSNLGQGPEGITPAELTERVVRALLDGALKSVASMGGDVTKSLKDVGTGTTEELKKRARGIGDLLKTKPEEK